MGKRAKTSKAEGGLGGYPLEKFDTRLLKLT